jgi:heme exporter protein D
MYFDSFAEFLAMGRHGVYVWTAYGITTVLIGTNLFVMALRRRQVRATIRRALRRERMTRNQTETNEQRDESGT